MDETSSINVVIPSLNCTVMKNCDFGWPHLAQRLVMFKSMVVRNTVFFTVINVMKG